jgi:hypothetical protein
MKISFDFDSTLSEEKNQKLAKKFINAGHDVWITTKRLSSEHGKSKGWKWIITQNEELFEIAEELGIPKDKIKFTEGEDKWKSLYNFDIHFDDDIVEIDLIQENLRNCCGILICKN